MKLASMVAIAATALTLAACTESNPTSLPPGHYENTSTSTNSAGTEIETTKSTDVYRDADGNKRAVESSKTTKDPKGLFNKKTTSSSTKSYN